MKIIKKFNIICCLVILFSTMFTYQAFAQDLPKMTKEELKGMIDSPDLVVVDVRSGRDWKSSESKIKNAVREEPRKADSWGSKYDKNKTYVLYCA